jgi:hypothetical protein
MLMRFEPRGEGSSTRYSGSTAPLPFKKTTPLVILDARCADAARDIADARIVTRALGDADPSVRRLRGRE